MRRPARVTSCASRRLREPSLGSSFHAARDEASLRADAVVRGAEVSVARSSAPRWTAPSAPGASEEERREGPGRIQIP